MRYAIEAIRFLWRSIGRTRFTICCCCCFALAQYFAAGMAEAGDAYTVAGRGIKIGVSCANGEVTLTSIEDTKSSVNFLANGSTPLMSFSVDPLGPSNYYGSNFSDLNCTISGETLSISANSPNGLLSFSITLAPDANNPAVIVSTQLEFLGPNPTAFFRVKLPDLQTFTLPGSAPMGMVPQMIGGVLPLAQIGTVGLGATVGLALQRPTFGLPTSLNAMEVADVYDNGGGGLFFADLDGDYAVNIAPLQMNITNAGSTTAPAYQIAGYWTAVLKPRQWVNLPRLAIGVHAQDWHQAVDYYVKKRSSSWTFPDTPSWLREAGGIYLLGVAGGGSFFNTFPDTPTGDRNLGIELFACNSTITVEVDGKPKVKRTKPFPNGPGYRCLRDVLADAQTLGSNVIYLTQWWPGTYKNQGDWIVDPALGGAKGLVAAVDDVHKHGGKVLLYLQPYTAAASSILVTSGQAAKWQALPGNPIPPNVTNPAAICMWTPADCMAIPNTEWQDYIINRAVSLVEDTHVDGFFLDTWGWEMNWPVQTSSEDVNYTSQEWTAAALRFVDRLRAAIRTAAMKVNPDLHGDYKIDPVVLGENNTSELQFHWDGGSAADLNSWTGNGAYFRQDGGVLWGSPIRYAMPNTSFFVNGSGLSIFNTTVTDACGTTATTFNGSALTSVNQLIAAGHSLALGPFFLLDVSQVGTVTNNTMTVTYPPPPCPSGAPPPPPSSPPYNTAVSNYIRSLIQIRNSTYKDALVYGKQLPVTTNPGPPDIVAYLYQGTHSQLLAIVNNTGATQSVTVTLSPTYGTGSWTNALDSTSINETAAGTVTIELTPPPSSTADPIGGLAILARRCGTSCAGRENPPGVTHAVPLMTESFCITAVCWGSGGGANWTDWALSPANVPVATGRWSWTPDALTVDSPIDNSLLFYDSFGGGDFTYSGVVVFSTFSGTYSAAGLSFRLSDSQRDHDAGTIQGYDLIVTNVPHDSSASGSVALYKRPYTLGKDLPLCGAPLNVVPSAATSPFQTYHLSVTATNAWQKPPEFGGGNPPYPQYPQSTHFTASVGVSVPGEFPPYVASAEFTCTDDNKPFFSGRFGVYASNASVGFTCLQANEDPPFSLCPLPSPFQHPPPRQ
jgi:hypothetical protein